VPAAAHRWRTPRAAAAERAEYGILSGEE